MTTTGKRAKRAAASLWMTAALCVSCGLMSMRGVDAWGSVKSTSKMDYGRGARVCFVAASLPWTFGAYQAQAFGLSKAFADHGYETFWMPRVPDVRLPPGEYADYKAASRYLTNARKPSKAERDGFAHLTFLGVPTSVKVPSKPGVNPLGLTMRQLDAAAENHKLDAFILLMDVTQLYLDGYKFRVPTLLWMPFHHEELDAHGGVLSTYSAIASLSETTRKAVEGAQALTKAIPHFIIRAELDARADAFEEEIKDDVDGQSRVNAIREALFDSKKYDRMFKRDIDVVDEDTFVVLMQGGNYEGLDRKGWSDSIRAFAQFQRENPRIKTHLWIHAMDSAMTQADLNDGSKPPVSVTRSGVPLRAYLENSGIPSNMYTLDENKHDASFTTALKRHADVCLHTSKAEGFGMVVLECQALGTPVVTTEYTAMRDYTKFGISVPPSGLQPMGGAFLASPDVRGTAAALGAIASGEAKLASREDVFKWIDSEFSIESVYRRFHELLEDAKVAHKSRNKWKSTDTFESRPLFTVVTDEHPRLATWDTPWTLYHNPKIKVDYGAIQKFMLRNPNVYHGLAMAQTVDHRGVPIPMDPSDKVHNINPKYVVVLRTWMMRQIQEQHSYVWSIVHAVMGTFADQSTFLPLPGGVAVWPKEDEGKNKDEL